LADRYAIERELGQGGMATVYLAEDLKHHRKVALKVLRPELAGFLRVVTHPRVFHPPTPLAPALAFTHAFRERANAVLLAPGARHWTIFTKLCRESAARGNLVPDAWLAALAIESGCEFVTTDRDYARFPGLRWRHPLDGAQS